MKKVKILSVDFQKDFTSERGKAYKRRPSVSFVKEILVPYLEEKNIKVAEIISDYRQPRRGDRGALCCPGTTGYESEISKDVKAQKPWIKCMNSPIWVRDNIGDPEKKPGLPIQSPHAFTAWLTTHVGKPGQTTVVLVGLTLDCCVLCTAQELSFRGYEVRVLEEATDTFSGDQQEKKQILHNPPLSNWAGTITWNTLQKKL